MGHGYEGRSIEEYVADLVAWGTSVLVDVRLNPISRKKGFSKKALAAAVEEAGIRYVHRPQLGNPKDNREGFGVPGTPAAREAHARYREILAGESAASAVDELAATAANELVVLMCFEASERCCHRSLVLDRVKARQVQLQPV